MAAPSSGLLPASTALRPPKPTIVTPTNVTTRLSQKRREKTTPNKMISGSTIHMGVVRRSTLVISTLVYSSAANSSSRLSDSQKPATKDSRT